MAGVAARRRYYLDVGLGQTRGVVTLDDRPERLFIDRAGEGAQAGVGARFVARAVRIDKALNMAFLDLGAEPAVVSLKADSPPFSQGQALEVEIRAEARQGKAATARLLALAEGAPRLLAPAPDLASELSRLAGDAEVERGAAARTAADEAEAEALEREHLLPGGGSLSIEPTRALTAVDVDAGSAEGADSKRAARRTNLEALSETARLLRLKGLAGLVVIDLVGRGHDAQALLQAARQAFAPDNPGVAVEPVNRFGTISLIVPRRRRPVIELLTERPAITGGFALLRRIEQEAAANPGARLEASASPAVAQAAAAWRDDLAARIGARFEIKAQATWPERRMEVIAR